MSKIVLGSGKVYIMEFTGELPESESLEISANLLGKIQGGASLVYTPTFYECEDDLATVSKKIITKEVAILKTGVLTWNGETLEKLCSTATVTTTANKRTVKIGGIGNYNGKKYVIRFVHEDEADGDVRVTIVGSNEAGFELVFLKDKETVVNAEFKACSCDEKGTKIIYEEEIKGA